MPKIHEITVTVRNPIRADDLGSCEPAFYTVDDNVLTLVTANGTPLRNNSGERITAHLAAGEDARRVASRLFLARWRSERARDGAVPGFDGPIQYPASYVAY